MPITGTTFLLGTLSLCGIPPLACFWSKDEIIAESWLCSSSLGWITSITAGFTASYMFRIYLLTFEGVFRGDTGQKNVQQTFDSYFYEDNLYLWGNIQKDSDSFGDTKALSIDFIAETNSVNLNNEIMSIKAETSYDYNSSYPKESTFGMLLPLLILSIPTLFAGFIGINNLTQDRSLDLLSEWLIPIISPDQNRETFIDFLLKSIGSLTFSFLGIFFSYTIYGPNWFFGKKIFVFLEKNKIVTKNFLDSLKFFVQGWSLNRGFIDQIYQTYVVHNLIYLSKSITFFDRWFIDGVINGSGILSLFSGEGIKYAGGGRVSYYLFGLTIGVILLIVLTALLL
jgi:NAD(P)H-quinone oxidoreductase subunit 5